MNLRILKSIVLIFSLCSFVNPILVFSDNVIEVTNKTTEIRGKIVDNETNEGIPFCSIYNKDTSVGTSSNELGEFILKVDSLPINLTFSHINYEVREVKIFDQSSITIELKKNENILDEIVVSDGDIKIAKKLVYKALEKNEKSYKKSIYARALYRQKSKNDDKYSEFAEIIYDVNFNRDGIIDWDIFEGRYALNKNMINNKNYTLLSKILKVFQPDDYLLKFPLSSDFLKYYSVRIIEVIKSSQGKLATIYFKPLNSKKSLIIEGEVTINMDSYEVYKFSGAINDNELNLITLKDKSAKKKNYKLLFEMSFKYNENLGMLLDYINVSHSFDYYKDNNLLTKLYASSNLSFYEYHESKIKKQNKIKYKGKSSIWDKLDVIGYDKRFWNENPIVRRTPVDEDIIKSFEKVNAFGSIFLNSNKQITLTESDISNDSLITQLDKTIFKNIVNNQKVFLHINKKVYEKGEKIFYSAYVKSQHKNVLFNESDFLHIDLIKDNKLIKSNVCKIVNGRGYGHFTLDNLFEKGEYSIIAYTNWMRNYDIDDFYISSIRIDDYSDKNADNEVSISFYPEGDLALNNVINRVAFKAQNKNGIFLNVKGKIIDSDEKFITTFKSKYNGLGYFYYKPIKGKSYFVLLDNKNKYKIPDAKSSGFSMIVNNTDKNVIKIDIRGSKELKQKQFYVLGLVGNKKYYQASFNIGNKQKRTVEIPKRKIPGGIFTIIIMDKHKKIFAKRSVFIKRNYDYLKIEKELANKNDTLFLKIKTADYYNNPVKSNISISIAKKFNKTHDDIITKFKFDSNESNSSNDNEILFNDDKKSFHILDLKLLTKQTKSFKWLDNTDTLKVFREKKGVDIYGIAYGEKNKPLSNKKIKMSSVSKYRLWSYESKTNERGEFIISDFTELDTVKLNFKSYDDRDKQIFSKVKLINKKDLSYLSKLDFIESSLVRPSDSIFYLSESSELLNEVTVIGNVKKEKENSLYNITPDEILTEDKIYGNNIRFLISTLPNIELGVDGLLYIRKYPNPPIWILDGIRIEDPRAIDLNNLKKIEVIKSLNKSVLFGSEGRNGVVILYSKDGKQKVNELPTTKIKQVFISTNNSERIKNKPDSNVIFWSPEIISDEHGLIDLKIKLPKNKQIEKLRIHIQGISENGEIGSYSSIVNVNKK